MKIMLVLLIVVLLVAVAPVQAQAPVTPDPGSWRWIVVPVRHPVPYCIWAYNRVTHRWDRLCVLLVVPQ